jgi:hypothetical protein
MIIRADEQLLEATAEEAAFFEPIHTSSLRRI